MCAGTTPNLYVNIYTCLQMCFCIFRYVNIIHIYCMVHIYVHVSASLLEICVCVYKYGHVFIDKLSLYVFYCTNIYCCIYVYTHTHTNM